MNCKYCGRKTKRVDPVDIQADIGGYCFRCAPRVREEFEDIIKEKNAEIEKLKAENKELNNALDVYLNETLPNMLKTIAELRKEGEGMKEPSILMDDKRKIISIWLGDESGWRIDRNDITAIVPYYETGEMGYVLWFAVYKGDEIISRVNGKFVWNVNYY